MAQENKIQMPGVFGGLMRYDDEYNSKFMIPPAAVVAFAILIFLFVVAMKVFFKIGG